MSSADSTATADVVEFSISVDDIGPYLSWHECAAVRFAIDGDMVALQVTHRPRCEKCDGKGTINAAGRGRARDARLRRQVRAEGEALVQIRQRTRAVCDLCDGTGQFVVVPEEECAQCGGSGYRQPRQPRQRRWAIRGVSIPALRCSLVSMDDVRIAPLAVLRRREYMRVFRLPGRRLFIVSWMEL